MNGMQSDQAYCVSWLQNHVKDLINNEGLRNEFLIIIVYPAAAAAIYFLISHISFLLQEILSQILLAAVLPAYGILTEPPEMYMKAAVLQISLI